MLFVVEVDVQGPAPAVAERVEEAVRQRLVGCSTSDKIGQGTVATVTHCKRLTMQLLDDAGYWMVAAPAVPHD